MKERFTNKAIAKVLKETGAMIDLTGGNAFKSRAYQNGARVLERLEESAYELIESDTLTEVKGIGKSIARDIAEYTSSGMLQSRDRLLGAIPPGLTDLLRIKGLGAKKVRQLWKEQEITNLDELEMASKSGRLNDVKGFGEKLSASIIKNIAFVRAATKQRRLANAVLGVSDFMDGVKSQGLDIEFTGQIRRQLNVVDSVELLGKKSALKATAELAKETLQDLDIQEVKITGTSLDGFPVSIQFVDDSAFGTALFESTGSKEFTDSLAGSGDLKEHPDEEAVFASLKTPWTHPALREGKSNPKELASSKASSRELIQVSDLRGSLHNHSTYSDGAHSLSDMTNECVRMGLEYFGICDHSQSLHVANGLSPDRVIEQHKELKAINAKLNPGFKIFAGIESDILLDGSLDYEEDILKRFDFIVASVHSGFNMTQDEGTARLIKAIENPYTRILGHPTGRVLLSREGYPIDHAKVIDACAANGVALELNASPYRLDIDWTWIPYAVEKDVLIAVNPDAHSMQDLHCWEWGVRSAQKGKLSKKHCLNAMSLSEFQKWIDQD